MNEDEIKRTFLIWPWVVLSWIHWLVFQSVGRRYRFLGVHISFANESEIIQILIKTEHFSVRTFDIFDIEWPRFGIFHSSQHSLQQVKPITVKYCITKSLIDIPLVRVKSMRWIYFCVTNSLGCFTPRLMMMANQKKKSYQSFFHLQTKWTQKMFNWIGRLDWFKS